MAFGGFAPFPFRLGGSAEEGWSAREHARAAADLVAIKRVLPIARLTYDFASGVVTIRAYAGRNGIGTAQAPTPTVLGTGAVRWTWPTVLFDSLNLPAATSLRYPRVTARAAPRISAAVLDAANQVTVSTRHAATNAPIDTGVTLTIY